MKALDNEGTEDSGMNAEERAKQHAAALAEVVSCVEPHLAQFGFLVQFVACMPYNASCWAILHVSWVCPFPARHHLDWQA